MDTQNKGYLRGSGHDGEFTAADLTMLMNIAQGQTLVTEGGTSVDVSLKSDLVGLVKTIVTNTRGRMGCTAPEVVNGEYKVAIPPASPLDDSFAVWGKDPLTGGPKAMKCYGPGLDEAGREVGIVRAHGESDYSLATRWPIVVEQRAAYRDPNGAFVGAVPLPYGCMSHNVDWSKIDDIDCSALFKGLSGFETHLVELHLTKPVRARPCWLGGKLDTLVSVDARFLGSTPREHIVGLVNQRAVGFDVEFQREYIEGGTRVATKLSLVLL